jgi:SAM-dependent methyltransferase
MDALELQPGHSVLDVGCGCGATALALAERVGPEGRVVGVDVSQQMLARARQRIAGQRIELLLGDAAQLPLPEVDRLFSRFGVMVFDEPTAAFAHLRSALCRGGRISFVCWRSPADNEWVRVPMEAVSRMLGPPEPADPTAPGPFAFADRDRVARILAEAGFRDVAIETLDRPVQWTTTGEEAELRHKIVRIGPAARRLLDVEPELRERAVDAIVQALRPRIGPDGWRASAAAWRVTAGTAR